VLRHPLKRYLFLPFVLSVGLAIVTMIAARRYWSQELSSVVSGSPLLGGFFLGVMTIVGGIVLFLIAQPLLLAVFSDTLSERVERIVKGTSPTVPFFASAGRALVHGLLKLVLYGTALVVALVLTPAGGIGPVVGIALAALFLAYDGFDYPARPSRRQLRREMGVPGPQSRPDNRIRNWRNCPLPDSVRSIRRFAVCRGGCHVGIHGHGKIHDRGAGPRPKQPRQKTRT
jgi:uncharacterized protein involved in cysteine biosynthesis